jgi:hypothetical protein
VPPVLGLVPAFVGRSPSSLRVDARVRRRAPGPRHRRGCRR